MDGKLLHAFTGTALKTQAASKAHTNASSELSALIESKVVKRRHHQQPRFSLTSPSTGVVRHRTWHGYTLSPFIWIAFLK